MRVGVRDGLSTAAGLLREAGWLALDGLASRAGGRGDPVGPAWLTDILAARFPGVRVGAVHPLGGDSGTTDRVRLAVTYDDAGSGPTPPGSLFVKRPPARPATRLFVNLLRLGATEVRFYCELAADVPIEVPAVLHAAADGGGRRFVLVLEDLAARAARFTDVSQPLGVDAACAVVRSLARLHAAFWESARFDTDLGWLTRRGEDPVGRCLSAVAVPPGLRRFADLVPPELHAAAGRITAARARLDAAWSDGPRTLVHGDAHAGNLYFLPDDGVGFLDWQVVQAGQGMRDVTYFLVQSLPTDLRRRYERRLVELYLGTLSEHGVAAPGPDVAWRQHRLHALYAWIAAVVTAAAATLQSEAIVRTGLARTSAAVLELDSLALVG
jgi:hypothetical protein